MKKSAWRLLIASVSLLFMGNLMFAQDTETNPRVLIKTDLGDIIVELYKETPKHRDNFLKLVEEGFYDGTSFHRVIEDFMIQGGDPTSINAKKDAIIGNGGPGYTLPAEINPNLIHKRGTLAAARQPDNVNPNKESNGSQFYIVTGVKYQESDLQNFAQRREQQMKNDIFNEMLNMPENAEFKKRVELLSKVGNQKELNFLLRGMQPKVQEAFEAKGGAAYTEEQVKIYAEEGGKPHLDGGYTVFGEVVKGMDVVEKISKTKTNAQNRPTEDVLMKKLKVLNR